MECRTLLSTILVDTFADEMESDATTSLREAIALAASTEGDDTIVLPRIIDGALGPYTLSLGELAVDDLGALTIRSEGGRATIDALGTSRVVSISARSVVELDGLTITGGEAEDSGGAIFSSGTLSVIDCDVTGEVTGPDSGSSRRAYGGGIYNDGGRLSMVDSSVYGEANSAHAPNDGIYRRGDGGAIYNLGGSVTITDSQVRGRAGPISIPDWSPFNALVDGDGGAIYNLGGSVTIDGGTIFGVAGTSWFGDDYEPSGSGSGGAIFNDADGTITIGDSSVSGGAKFAGGVRNLGILEISASSVWGGTWAVDGASAGGIGNQGTATITESSISGSVQYSIYDWGGRGGGIYNTDAGVMTLIDTAVEHCESVGYGGGIYNAGTLTLLGGSVSHNTSGVGPRFSYYYGSGGAGIANRGTLSATNTLIIGNRIENANEPWSGIGFDDGEAIATGVDPYYSNDPPGRVTLTNCTLTSGWSEPVRTSDLYVGSRASVNLVNTIVGGLRSYGSVYADHSIFAAEPDGTIFGWGNLIGVNPQQSPSGLPAPGSPAIDAGRRLGDVPTDNRGVRRPQGSGFDIGAFEVLPGESPPIALLDLQVQDGQAQRSYIREIRLEFFADSPDAVTELVEREGIRMYKLPVVRWNPYFPYVAFYGSVAQVPLDDLLSVSGDLAVIDFGPQGIGGNRNSTDGEGLYRIEADVDGDGFYEQSLVFHRLLGDVNGDRSTVASTGSASDLDQILQAYGTDDPESDVNGDGAVNALDRILAIRNRGKIMNIPFDF